MTPDEHRELRELLGAYSLGHLSVEERLAVRAHLDGCPDCRRELAEIEPLARTLTSVSVDRLSDIASPDPALGERIVSAVGIERRRRDRDVGRSRILLAAAAVLAVLAVGGVGIAIGNRTADAPTAATVPIEAVAVAADTEGVRASAGVVAHTWGVEIKLEAVGLDAGAPYEVIVRTDDGRLRSAGAFVGTGAETMNCNLNSDVLRPDAAGFEVLDASGERVLSAQL